MGLIVHNAKATFVLLMQWKGCKSIQSRANFERGVTNTDRNTD